MKQHHVQFLNALKDCDVHRDHVMQIMGNVLEQDKAEALSRAEIREEKRRKVALNEVAEALRLPPPFPDVLMNSLAAKHPNTYFPKAQ